MAPTLAARQPNTLAIIIGNHDYETAPAVPYAGNDADAFAKTLKTLGVDSAQIRTIKNLTLSRLNLWFGTERRPGGRLKNLIPSNVEHVIVFYSGHGVPGEAPGGLAPYLLPVDGSAAAPEVTGYPLKTLKASLATLPVKQVTLIMDACFSGLSPAGNLVPETSGGFGVAVAAPEQQANVTVLSATAYDARQFANWREDDEHGAFTYHLIGALTGGAADQDRNGRLTMGEIAQHVSDALRRDALTWPEDREQTPHLSNAGDTVFATFR
ncbi:MAG: caspase family protein [Pseudomonadota bacterium]